MKDLHKYISYKAFLDSPHPSSKHSTYFPAYDDIFTKYIGKEITFVEVGIFDGGSLFMWRNFFGKQARIIGIELNPEAKNGKKMVLKYLLEINLTQIFGEIFISKLVK